jgi:hypothetical protein
MKNKKVTLELYIPAEYTNASEEMLASVVLDAITKSEFLKKDIIDCIKKNGVRAVDLKGPRVYMWDISDRSIDRNSQDEEIMGHCESTGMVCSLDYFEDLCNDQELNIENYFIRII